MREYQTINYRIYKVMKKTNGRNKLADTPHEVGAPWAGTEPRKSTDYGFSQDTEAMREQTVQSTAKSFRLTMRPDNDIAQSLPKLLWRASQFSGIVVVNAMTSGIEHAELWNKTQEVLQGTDMEPTPDEIGAINKWLGISE